MSKPTKLFESEYGNGREYRRYVAWRETRGGDHVSVYIYGRRGGYKARINMSIPDALEFARQICDALEA